MSLSSELVAYLQAGANQFNATFKVVTQAQPVVPPPTTTDETTLFAPNVPSVVIPVVEPGVTGLFGATGPATLARMNELSGREPIGTLTDAERTELAALRANPPTV